MGDLAISLKHVSKSFRQYPSPVAQLKGTLFKSKHQGQDFWALQDISLDVYKGQTLGIIGRNGAGKSTLLQIICGTLKPTSGDVSVHGRIAALLELGAGFNPEFSGRENVFLNGAILGLTKVEIRDRLEAIEAFADIGNFINQPVKTYSSGMFMRLAFAVAIHVDPDILIVDEALSVGDIFFQQKCFQRLDNLKRQGTSIIFVSHSTQAVVNLCDRAIILQKGRLAHEGEPADMAAKYIEIYYGLAADQNSAEGGNSPQGFQGETTSALALDIPDEDAQTFDLPEHFVTEFPNRNRYGKAAGLIQGIAMTDSQGVAKSVFSMGEEVVLSIKVNAHSQDLSPLNIGFQIKNNMGQILVGTNTCMLRETVRPDLFGKAYVCQFRFPLSLAPAQYTISPAVAEYNLDAQVIYDWIEGAAVLDVIAEGWPRQIGLCVPDIQVNMAE